MLKLKCPNNCASQEFWATAHVTQDWVIDSEGDFVDVIANSESTTLHYPDIDDSIVCRECHQEAIKEED